MKIQTIITLTVIGLSSVSGRAQVPSPYQDYAKTEFVSGQNARMPYRVLSPTRIDSTATYPLVVFLHGYGERGTDNEKQLLHGGAVFSNPANADKFPAFVLFPQCKDKSWTGNINARDFMPGAKVPEESEPEKLLIALIRDFISKNPVDTSRIYLVGISMGGIATYDLACRHPEMFAAAVPICGAVNPERLSDATGVNFMIFHGEDDDQVPSFCSRQAYKALSSAGNEVDYIEFSGMGHDCWNAAFNYPSLFPWLFSQSKATVEPVYNSALTYNKD